MKTMTNIIKALVAPESRRAFFILGAFPMICTFGWVLTYEWFATRESFKDAVTHITYFAYLYAGLVASIRATVISLRRRDLTGVDRFGNFCTGLVAVTIILLAYLACRFWA